MTDKSKFAISLAHHVMTSVAEHHPLPEHRPLAAEHYAVPQARAAALREIAEDTVELPALEVDLIKSLQRAPEPEPAEEEVLDLIATDENIFGVMDMNEEQIGDGAGLEDLSSDDIEAAIAAELGAKR